MRRGLLALLLSVTVGPYIYPKTLKAQTTSSVKKVFYGGRIFTADPQHPFVQAVAIQGDKIVAVGRRTDAEHAVGSDAEEIDLHGETLLPGLIDGHVHLALGGFTLNAPDAGGWDSPIQTVDELVVLVNEQMRKSVGLRGGILMITRVPSPIWLHADELDTKLGGGTFESLPILLWGADGHTGWANRALRVRVGLTAEFLRQLSPEQRSLYGINKNFEPNGLAVDDGLGTIMAALPQISQEEELAWAKSAVGYLNSLGITAWLDALAGEPELTAYRDLSAHGALTAHVAAFPEVKASKDTAGDDPLAEVQALRKKFGGVANLTIPGIKIFADGVVEYPSQTAAMSVPYKNTGRTVPVLFDPDRFATVVTAADKASLIVHIHAIGDKAVTEALNGIEAARRANGNSGLPHTIAHLQFVAPSDFPRFKQLGVIADFQLLWASADTAAVELVKPYIDPSIYEWQYPAHSLFNAGATIAGGSDWYVSSPNPFLAIYQAETRRGPEGILNKHERMPREAMLYAYTRNAAMAMNQSDRIGTIAVGKQADLTIVDRDVMRVSAESLKETKVLCTIFGGKTIFGSLPNN